MRVRAGALLLAFLAASCDRPAEQAPPATVTASPQASNAPREFTREGSGHQAALTIDPEQGSLAFRLLPRGGQTSSALGMAERLELFRPLLTDALAQHGRRPEYVLSVGQYPELAARIAAAAACSPDWDLRTGQHRGGNAGENVRQLLNEQGSIQELSTFFATFRYDVSVRSAESVPLCIWGEVPGAEAARTCHAQPPPPPGARVPCGATLVFRLVARDSVAVR